jgi:hypothetical protein
VRGNSETSGVVGVKSKRQARSGAGAAAGGAGSSAAPTTVVPAPWRDASQPSAVSCS